MLKLNSFTLPLRFSEPTALPVIVTSLTVQATRIGGTYYTLTGGSSAYDSYDPLRIIISLTIEDVRELKLNTALATSRLIHSFLLSVDLSENP